VDGSLFTCCMKIACEVCVLSLPALVLNIQGFVRMSWPLAPPSFYETQAPTTSACTHPISTTVLMVIAIRMTHPSTRKLGQGRNVAPSDHMQPSTATPQNKNGFLFPALSKTRIRLLSPSASEVPQGDESVGSCMTHNVCYPECRCGWEQQILKRWLRW
jgi:hypothetical protein